MATETLKLVTYVFDHYIQPSDASDIYVMATEVGHSALARYMVKEEIFAMDRITHTFHFLLKTQPQSVFSETNDGLARWYYANSTVYVHEDNAHWSNDKAGKTRRKLGKISKTGRREEGGWVLGNMLSRHRADVIEEMAPAPETQTPDEANDQMEL